MIMKTSHSLVARRDKFLMNQVVEKHGLRVVKQKMCSSLEEAIFFAKDELKIPSMQVSGTLHEPSSSKLTVRDSILENIEMNGLLGRGINLPQSEEKKMSSSFCVVKPCRGVASDDVYFCKNVQDVENAFQKIHHTPVFGSSDGTTHESVVSLPSFCKMILMFYKIPCIIYFIESYLCTVAYSRVCERNRICA